MPKMVLNRNHILTGTSGHTIRFMKGVPTFVVPQMVEAALGIGAESADEVSKDEVDEQLASKEAKPKPEVLQGEARRGKIKEVLENIAARNDKDDFTAANRPKLESVKAQLEFNVDRKEVDTIWNEVIEARNAVGA